MTEVAYGGSVGVVVVAAGSGTRLGGEVAKGLRLLGGVPLLVHALMPFAGLVDHVCAVVPAESVDAVRPALAAATLVVAGGATRQASVDAGLRALPSDIGIVLVHDAARPFVPASVVAAVLAALRDGADAVIPVLPVVDTIKEVDAAGVVVATPPRDRLRLVQTPQGFRRSVLMAAHAHGVGGAATDDAGLVEQAGGQVQTVPGALESFKITGPADWEQAERFVAVHAAAAQAAAVPGPGAGC